MNRRTFIAAAGASAISLAGCLGGGTGDNQDDSDPTPGATTGSDDPLGGHPAAADLADQPAMGPDPASAPAVIISFSDPSCPNCARFEDKTVPEIESRLVETDKAALVYRNLPIMKPWGKPATRALEGTFAHDAEAFWPLKDHYFANRDAFDTDNVFSKTESFLAENTRVDAEAVVSGAEAGEYDDAVEADRDAAEEAGVSSTPASLLFKDGEHVTTVSGAKSYTVIAEALGY